MSPLVQVCPIHPMPLEPGTVLGRYEIRSQLGAGGMGEVYLAQDMQLDRTVALKVLPSDVSSNQQRMNRFVQEAKTASALNHPNIITIYEIGSAHSLRFIATEFIDGVTLRRQLSEAPMKISEALDIACQVAAALSAAHEAGIIHRDIKPENIMLRRDGYVKVLDFGLAKLTESPAVPVNPEAPTKALIATDPGTVLGTVQYMSPEQARGLIVDARSDIFSLGIVVYELVAGHAPFEGRTKFDVITSIIDREPAPLARYSREVPETLEWIVTKALRKDADERYQTSRELLTDLRSLRQRMEFAAEQERSVPPTSRSEAPVATITGCPPIGTVEEKQGQTDNTARPTSAEYLLSQASRRKPAVVIALAVLILFAASLVWGLRYFGHRARNSEPFARIKLSRLTTTGKATFAAVSPDGKYVAHVMGAPGEQAIWLRHIATGSDKEIAPSVGVNYCCPFFSHDGNHVYYLKTVTNAPSVTYQVPVLGGAVRTILEDADSQPALSPDGNRFAFIRGFPPQGIVALLVTNLDGTGEKRLATYDIVSFFAPGITMYPGWSPDGEVIVLGVPASDAAGSYRQMLAVRAKDGAASPLTSQRWSSLGQFGWLTDGSGLIFTASDQGPGSPLQIWYVSYPSGKTRRITNDLNDYRGISLTADSRALVTVQRDQTSSVWMVPNGEVDGGSEITNNKYDGLNGVVFTPDGRIVYTSRTGGNTNVWIVNADRTGQKQLTADAGSNTSPAISPDGRYVVFESDRAGSQNIWRMNIDGTNPKQLTRGRNDQYPDCSPDGRWVVYTSNDPGTQTIWRVPIEGGNPIRLTDYTSARPVVSPDGKQIALAYLDQEAKPQVWVVGIIPFDGGRPKKSFDIQTRAIRLRWVMDGRALTYILTRGGISNIWRQPSGGGKPVQLTDFKSDQIYFFDWSRGNKQLVLARGSLSSDVVLIADSE